MDGLEALTSAVGPGMSAYNAGVDTSRKYEEQQNQQTLRQAQMQEIMQTMKQRELTNPLDVQHKQLQNETAQFEQKIKKNTAYSDVLERAAPMLEAVPPAARHAQLMNMVQSHGLDANDPEIKGFMQSMQNVPADKIPAVLSGISTKLNEQSRQYQQAIAVAEIQRKSHVEGAKESAAASRYATDQRSIQAAQRIKTAESALMGKPAAVQEAGWRAIALQAEADGDQIKALEAKKRAEEFGKQADREKSVKDKAAAEGRQDFIDRLKGNTSGKTTPGFGTTSSGTKFKVISE